MKGQIEILLLQLHVVWKEYWCLYAEAKLDFISICYKAFPVLCPQFSSFKSSSQAHGAIFLCYSLCHVGHCNSPVTMHRMFPTEKQTRRRLWRMSEKVRGHQLTRARGCPMTTGDIFMPAIQILHQVLQVGEP